MIFLGSDHGGFELKKALIKYIKELDLEYKDLGTDSNQRCDYPYYAQKVCENMKDCDLGILICKTRIGMSIVANKFKNIRAALCIDEEMGRCAKEHNDANILVLPANLVDENKAIRILRYFLAKSIEDETHIERVKMIEQIENKNMK